MKCKRMQRRSFGNLPPLLGFLISFIFFFSFASAQTLKIYCIDVDQGSSTLVVTPNNKSILIDCGDDKTADSVYNVITSIAGLSSISYFVCTHYHDDHYGALDKLIDKGLVITDHFYDRDSQKWLAESRTSSDDYAEYARIAEDKRSYLRPGNKIPIDPEVEVECIVANGRAKGEYGQIEYPSDENGYSIGLLISFNGFDFLIAGDLNEEIEPKLATMGILKDVDVYHVSHHGAETSSCDEFLGTIKPEVCIISSGTHGTYKHPRKNTIDRLHSLSSIKDVFQISKNVDDNTNKDNGDKIGNVPDEFIGDFNRQGDAGTILIEAEGNTYTVKILSRNIAKVYDIEK